MTIIGAPRLESTAWRMHRLGWFTAAAARASARRAAGGTGPPGRRTFRATLRFSDTCSAR
jgi:hypothetical protein